MKTYIINMPSAAERRRHVAELFQRTGIEHAFVEAVVGSKLSFPNPDYRESLFRLAHGKRTNPGEVGCYLSHLKVLSLFLESGEEFALVCEDDIRLRDGFPEILREALEHSAEFDLLRLSGLHRGAPVPAVRLPSGYSLCHNLTRQTGSGAYLVNRRAAQVMVRKLRPMWLPFDHAFDRDWVLGIRAMCINPMPVVQNNGFASQIDADRTYKLPALIRYPTVFPFRLYNETSRLVARTAAILARRFRNVRRFLPALAPG